MADIKDEHGYPILNEIEKNEEKMVLETDDNILETFTIPSFAAQTLKSLMKERDDMIVDYSKKIDLFLLGILAGHNIKKSQIVSGGIDWKNMQITIKPNEKI